MRPANGQGKAQPPTPRSAPRGPGDAAYYARMAWLVLVAAGCLEVVWALGLKRTEGFTKLVPSVLTLAATPETKEAFKQQAERALERGIFGAPSFVVGDELFWRDDRLEDAIAFATSEV